MLNDVEFREVHEIAKVDKVKIVACDGKSKLFVEVLIEWIYYKIYIFYSQMPRMKTNLIVKNLDINSYVNMYNFQ